MSSLCLNLINAQSASRKDGKRTRRCAVSSGVTPARGTSSFLTRLVLRFTPVNDGYSVENAPDESVWFPLSSIASTSHL
jgi:hypothetical protein